MLIDKKWVMTFEFNVISREGANKHLPQRN